MREHSSLFTKVPDLEKKAAELRLRALQSIAKAGVGATGSCMSIVEILTALYYGQLNGRPVMGMIVSFYQGKAAPILYAVLLTLDILVMKLIILERGALLSMKQGVKVPGVCFSLCRHGLSVLGGFE
jgi:transketolase N-terminal domain/subunit